MFAAKTNAELCGLSATGNAEAFTELVRRYQGAVCAVTYAATGRRDLSEDLAQETFLVAWRKLRERELEEPDKVAGWLVGIGRNLARKSARERTAEPLDGAIGVEDDAMKIEDAAVQQQTKDRVWELVGQLPPRYREVMVLYYREEESTPRVSELLGITVSAAEQRLSRGRKMLRSKVERELGDELAQSRPTEAFTRRVAAALPIGALAPASAAPTASSPSTIAKAISMKSLLSASIAIAATVAVGYGIFTLANADTPPVEEATASAPAMETQRVPSDRRHNVLDTTASGIVVDADSGAPLEGAVITIVKPHGEFVAIRTQGQTPGPAIAHSDDEGGWTIRGLAPGRYRATATAPGHLPANLPAFEISKEDDVRGLKFELAAGGLPLSGVITDVGGGPIAGATVRAKGPSRFPVSAVTDDEGRYELDVPHGRYAVSVWDLQYQDANKRVSVEGAGAEVDFELVPAATIAGRVIERSSGDPVAGAEVSFRKTVRYGGSFSTSMSGADDTAVTDAEGRFILQRLAPADYELYAKGDHLASAAATAVTLGIADQAESVAIPMDPAFNVTGKVFIQGDPSAVIEGASVSSFGDNGVARARSGPDGSFTMSGMLPGKYPLMIEGEGVISSSLEVTVNVDDADEAGVELAVEAGTTISGRIDPPGVAEVKVALRQATGGFEVMLMGGKIRAAHTTSEPDGSFTIPAVPGGQWKVVAETVDGAQGEVEVEVGEDGIDDLRLEMADRPSVQGRVVDPDGNPLPQLSVRLLKDISEVKGPNARFLARSGAETTTTDAQGRFTLVGLEPGRYHLGVQDHRGTPFTREGMTLDDLGEPIEIGESSIDGIELRVERPTQTIQGRVVDEDGTPQADAWVKLISKADGFRYDQAPVEVTDSEGHFAFESLAEGSYNLYVRSNRGDGLAELEEVAAGDSVELTLESLGTIRGVVTSGGSPVKSFSVDAGGFQDRAFYSEDGTFELPRMQPGHPLIVVTTKDGGTSQHVAVEGGEVTQASFDIGGWATIEGRAVDADGKPVAGLTVSAYSQGGIRKDQEHFMTSVTGEGMVVTGPDGRFSFDGVGAGRGSISLDEPGQKAASSAAVILRAGVHRGGKLFYTEAGSVTDVGDITVLDGDEVPEKKQGTLGMWAGVEYDRPKGKDEDDYVPPTGKPTSEPKLYVSHVYDDGPAADVGLKTGARVLSIDGESVDEMGVNLAASLLDSRRLTAGQVVRLEIEQGGETRTVELRAAPNSVD